MTRKSKIILASVVPSSLVAVAAAVWLLFLNPGNAAASVAASSVEIVEVERVVQTEGIEISGNIEPVNSADLAFPIAGYIDAIYVEEGDLVQSGDEVAQLEDSQQRYDLASVEVEIDTEIVTGTQRNLDLLELKREMTQESLDDTRLYTTISGQVTSVDYEVGDYVTAREAGTDSDVVVRVIDRSSMTAEVEVDELDAPYLSVGQEVEFQFDAYPDLEIPGTVSSVPLEARTTDQGIAVLDVEVMIDDPPDEILPYFTFAGEIFLADEEDILLIPEDAVMTFGTRTMVMLVMDAAEAEAAMAERMSARGGSATAGTGSGSRPAGGAGAMDADLQLPEGMAAVPTQVSVVEYGSGKVRVTDGLEVGDRIVMAGSGAADGEDGSAGDEEEGSANVMEMLGMNTSRGPGGGGPPPGP